MKTKQQQLQEFYEEKFLTTEIKKYSSPHLISLEAKNTNTDIMFIGQETNTWFGNWSAFQKIGVAAQMYNYENAIHELYYNQSSVFWKYLYEIINDTNTLPVWTNVFKYDLGDNSDVKNISKAPKESLAEIIDFHQGILAKEIEIIQPKIIIFFTGHNYDKLFIDPIIKKDGDYTKLYKKIDSISIDEWKCCHLDIKHFDGFENFNGVAYRTYHPMYLNRNINKFGKEIINFLKQEVQNVI